MCQQCIYNITRIIFNYLLIFQCIVSYLMISCSTEPVELWIYIDQTHTITYQTFMQVTRDVEVVLGSSRAEHSLAGV